MGRVDENAELGRVIAEGAESGLMSDKLAELLYIQDIGKSLAVIADSMRPTGHWKITYQGDVPAFCECSECGKLKVYDDYKYCPYCGAKMKENENDK